MNKTVVIITHSNDNASVQKVSDRIQNSGFNVFRFNSDQYPTEFMLEARDTAKGYCHTLIAPDGQQVDDVDVHAVWYRRLKVASQVDQTMEPQMRSACHEESKRSLLGFLTCTSAFKIDDYWVVKKSANKDLQLKIAKQIGLDMPSTLVTNNEGSVRRFFDNHKSEIITKMQSAFSIWEEGVEKVVFTNVVEDKHLENLDGLRQCPMVFQEKINKQLELRAVVVGNKVFCAAIDSNAFENMGNDWRKRGRDTLESWAPFELPGDVSDKLLTLTNTLGLNYGAIDLILTPNQEYKFLEINPCGEFYWMDHFTGLDICHSIADRLVMA